MTAVPEDGWGRCGPGGRVLLVGGTRAARAIPRQWLEQSGYAVWSVDRSGDWLRELAPSRPDVVVLEDSDGSGGGEDRVGEGWETPADLPVVVIQSSVDGRSDQVLSERAYDYLERPLDRTRLLTTVRNAVERRRLALQVSRFENSSMAGPASNALRSPPLPLAELERIAIENALEHTRGNLSAVGRQLGIGRTTLYRKIKKYGL